MATVMCIITTFLIQLFITTVSARNADYFCQQAFNSTQRIAYSKFSSKRTLVNQNRLIFYNLKNINFETNPIREKYAYEDAVFNLTKHVDDNQRQTLNSEIKRLNITVTYHKLRVSENVFSKFTTTESSSGQEIRSEFSVIRINRKGVNTSEKCISYPSHSHWVCNPENSKIIVCIFQFLNHSRVNITLTIKYQLFPNTHCVKEIENSLKVKVDDNINSSCGIYTIINPFRDIDINAQLETAQVAGTVSNCHNSNNCRFAPLTSKEGLIENKVLLLLHAALNPIFQDKDTGKCSNNFVVWKELKEIDLSKCNISTISDDYIDQVPHMEILNLANNNFSEVPMKIIRWKNIEELNLSGNPITNITQLTNLLGKLTKLHSLVLDNMPFLTVKSLRAILNVTELTTLSLNLCNLSCLPSGIFGKQSSLQNIHLSGNLFQTLPNDIFIVLKSPSFINLSHNALHNGPRLQLSGIVETLDLSSNNIINVSNVITSERVNNLILKGNNIREWTDCDIWSSKHNDSKEPWVSRLDLSNNNIETITSIMGKSLEGLDEINLGGNPIDCNNCHTIEFKDWLNSKRDKPSILNHGNISCVLPAELATRSVMELEHSPVSCNTFLIKLRYILIIPLTFICIVLVVLAVVYRNKIRNIRSMRRKRRQNRKRAIGLSPIQYENDIYLVFSPEDSDFVLNKLCPSLGHGSQKYRLFIPNTTSSDFSEIKSDISKCRNVLVIMTDSLATSEFCTRAVEDCIASNKEEFVHNMIFLKLIERSTKQVPSRIMYLSAIHDYIPWSLSGKSHEKGWRQLINYLGTSNCEEWQKESADYIAL